jgi:hypothetical protein
MGKLKRRNLPRDVTINIGKGCPSQTSSPLTRSALLPNLADNCNVS